MSGTFFTPSMHFDGRCAEAMAFYQRALDGKMLCRMTYADANSADGDFGASEQTKHWIYHAEMELLGQRFLMADDLEMPCVPSSLLFLTITFDTVQQAMAAFEALSEGGHVIYPPRKRTYSACHCSLVDRFGIRWTLLAAG